MMMDETELVGLLADKISRALNDEDGEISTIRQENLDYYLGELYGNERDGYSQYRSREVLETVEWCLPALLRVFAAGDVVVSFSPVGPEDEVQAQQETDAVNAALTKSADFYLTCYNWIKSALLEPVAYSKIWMEETKTACGETYKGLTLQELMLLMNEPGVEILEQAEYMQDVPLYDVRIRRTHYEPKLRWEPVPGEETLVDESHTRLRLDDAEFVCHRVKRTYSWLV
jgi:hypothetical protein